jgi:hypothetical protein
MKKGPQCGPLDQAKNKSILEFVTQTNLCIFLLNRFNK